MTTTYGDEATFSTTDMGMRIDWQVPIQMSDGVTLRADVFRPDRPGRFPVILSHGVYAKGLPFQSPVYEMQWAKLLQKDPSVLEGSSNKYQAWEVTDPERWVPDGYVVVRVDSRGAGWSPGFLDPFSPREIEDGCASVEWAGTQDWSSGRVGLLGISYYAVMSWHIAAQRPRHLAAFIAWEGFSDHYRGPSYHGGIRNQFVDRWQPTQLVPVQFGQGERALRNPHTNQSVAGPMTLSEDELAANRSDYAAELRRHSLLDEWHRERTVDPGRIEVPFLSAANWGGQGLHPTGNFRGFELATGTRRWLEVHGDTHWTHFYSSYGRSLQRAFFDTFLAETSSGFASIPPVILNVRRPAEVFTVRYENEWPLARTNWARMHLRDSGEMTADPQPQAASLEYRAMGAPLRFLTPIQDTEVEITGPLSATLFISSTTVDADLFLVVQLLDPHEQEVTFEGSTDPNTPVANGWLRASHRALVDGASTPWRPVHPHDAVQPLTPGKIYEVQVELWPTSIVVPAGYRLALMVGGRDYEYTGELDAYGEGFVYATRGTGGMTHSDPSDRPADVFDNFVTIHLGPETPSHLLVPVIPANDV